MNSTMECSGSNSLTRGEVTSQLQTTVSPEWEEQPTNERREMLSPNACLNYSWSGHTDHSAMSNRGLNLQWLRSEQNKTTPLSNHRDLQARSIDTISAD